jgi:hypothetical protein
MTTLVTHHNGMDRVLRGVELVVQGLYGTAQGVRRARLDATHNKTDGRFGFFARWKADWVQRRLDREFEALMRADPRIRSEFAAAKARSEWEV